MPELDQELGAEPGAEAGAIAPELTTDTEQPISGGGGADREGAMAKADLYKLASYSHKLFKQIDDNDQLEAWVQAKITKAADYIASVYHYLEYEMKFSEYGKSLDDSDVLSESQKMKLKEILSEAKSKVKDLKKAQAEKVTGKDKKVEEGFEKVGDTKKTRTGELTKTATGVIHKNTSYSDEERGEVNDTHAKAKSASEKKKEAPTQKKSKTGTWGMEGGKKFDNRKKMEEAKEKCCCEEKGKSKCPVHGKVEEGNDGNLANNAKPYDKVTRGDVIAGRLGKDEMGGKKKKVKEVAEERCDECGMYESKCECDHDHVKESAKPSAGLSKAKKSAVVKKAKAGGDIGKPGKSFDKVAKAAGGGEKGEKIAAAAMWKNIKETTAYLEEKKEAEKKAKEDYDKDGKIETGSEEHAGAVDNAIKASKKKETVKESADFSQFKANLKRLLG